MKRTQLKAQILVIVEGGIVQDVLADDGSQVTYGVWDWNDFEDDPVAYWEERGDEFKALYKQTVHADTYRDVLMVYERAKKAEQAEREAERRKDPFYDVEEVQS